MGLSPRALSLLVREDLDDPINALHLDFSSQVGGPDIDPRQLAALRLESSLLKKFQDEESPDAESRAFALWSRNNSRCGEWSYKPNTSSDEVLWGEFKRSLYHFFSDDDFAPSWTQICEGSRVGPGNTLLAKSTDQYSKLFSSPLSASNDLLHAIYTRDTMSHPSWFAAESSRTGSYGSSIVRTSRLSFVPKTRDIRRAICVEPNLNIYFQLGFASILSRRLFRRFGISLECQPDKNRELARLGSIDGSFATIDLSSASDSISYSLCKEIIPAHILGFLDQMRCETTSYRGISIPLHMVSSMGNGFTFPLQTIIFACMVEAAYRCRGFQMDKPFHSLGNFGVFGDDIIVSTQRDAGPLRDVLRLLDLAGFEVNHDKSFSEGFFRESCGCDYYHGRNVRGVYIKTLATVPGKFVAINRLLEWSARSGILLRRALAYLRRFVPDIRVPFTAPYDGGMRVPASLLPLNLKRRNQSIMYSYMAPRALFYSFSDQGTPDRMASRLGLLYNPHGLWMSFLAGHLRDGKIGIRSNVLRYHRRWKVTPFWNYFPATSGLTAQFGWSQWETTVELNLTDQL